MAIDSQPESRPRESILGEYRSCRDETAAICAPLHAEDTCIQTMPDVSPPKWHLAHTGWFFETFILGVYETGYRPFHEAYDYLFNSYYVTHGTPYPRPQRGLLSRPTLAEIMAYRDHVDEAMSRLLETADTALFEVIAPLTVLGINHEQQHQELLYTDIKHILAHNPLRPAFLEAPARRPGPRAAGSRDAGWIEFEGGIVETGHDGIGFAYDNEIPRHRTLLQPHALADRLVTNAEYLAFIEDGGYRHPELWMSEGWSRVQAEGWQAPLYWEPDGDGWSVFGFHGMEAPEPGAPVCHVSFYEADAFARWAGARLPTEFEWEHAAACETLDGNLRDTGLLRPAPQDGASRQFFGDAWEWTASAYTAYPGYRPAAGSIGEYNGKFMSGQMVLRGGSCVTPGSHVRASYRNFFYPPDRWQFSGIRLARDL